MPSPSSSLLLAVQTTSATMPFSRPCMRTTWALNLTTSHQLCCNTNTAEHQTSTRPRHLQWINTLLLLQPHPPLNTSSDMTPQTHQSHPSSPPSSLSGQVAAAPENCCMRYGHQHTTQACTAAAHVNASASLLSENALGHAPGCCPRTKSMCRRITKEGVSCHPTNPSRMFVTHWSMYTMLVRSCSCADQMCT